MHRLSLRLVPRSSGGRGALLLLIAAFVGLRLAEATGALPGWLDSWGDDLLCLPLVLTMALAVHRLAGRPADWILPWSHALAVLVLYAVLFELVLPRTAIVAVADPLDVAAYLVGGVLFLVLLNVPGAGRIPSLPAGTCGPR